MLALAVDTQKRRDLIVKEAFKQGLLIEGTGFRSIRFLPPLNVTKREIDIAVDILQKTCRKI